MEVSAQFQAPDALTPGKVPGTHWRGGWVGPKAGLDEVAKIKRNITASAGNWTPVVQPAACLYTD